MSRKLSHQPGHTVGAKLRAERLAKKYTQYQLAQPEFSVSYISAIERDQIQPSLRALEILSARLGLNSADLLPVRGQGFHKAHPAQHAASGDEEIDLLLLEAALSLHQRKPERAIELLRALPTLKDAPGTEALARYLLGRAYFESGLLQESEQELTAVAQLARETQSPLYPCILSVQQALYVALHWPDQANQAQREALLWLEQAPTTPTNAFFRAQLLFHLGRAASHAEQFARAQELFQQALAAFSEPISYEALVSAYQSQNAPQLAVLFGYCWLWSALQQRLSALRSEIQHALGRALRQSRPDEAYAALLEFAQEAEARHDMLTQASAYVHLAACLLERGEIEQAEEYARTAQSLAEQTGRSNIAADALLLQGELAYQRQAYERGDAFFDSGLTMLEELGLTEELVEQQAHYARLLEECGQLHRAIIYWKRAYEIRQRRG